MKIFLLAPDVLNDVCLGVKPELMNAGSSENTVTILQEFMCIKDDIERYVVTRSTDRKDPLHIDTVESERLLEGFRETVSGDAETCNKFEMIAIPATRLQIAINAGKVNSWLISLEAPMKCGLYAIRH